MDSNQFMNAQYMQPAPEPEKKGFRKGTFLLIGLTIGVILTCLLMGVVMTLNSKKAPEKLEGAGYDSPEEAVEAYVNYLKEGNLEGIISTFAVESYVDNYDMEEYYEYYQSFNIFTATGGQLTSGFYSDSDTARALNIESRRANIIFGLHKQMIQIMMQNTDEEEVAEIITEGTIYKPLEDEDIDAIMSFLSTDLELDSIEIGDFLDEKDFDISMDPLKRYFKEQKKIWNADIEPVTVELEIAGEDYKLFMLCVCYDGKWYIADFSNPIALSLGATTSCKGLVPASFFD